MTTEIANFIITTILTVVGLYLAHSYRRQVVLRVAERRLNSYAAMWSIMVVATPVRLAEWKSQPLTLEERQRLFDDLTAWYYKDGNGMLIGGGTRTMYLTAKDNLVCPVDYFKPVSIRTKLQAMLPEEQEDARGRFSIRQLSLLRSRMKADLEVYGLPYHTELDEDDKAFLKACDENLMDKPWGSKW